jgi:hypothetical protein
MVVFSITVLPSGVLAFALAGHSSIWSAAKFHVKNGLKNLSKIFAHMSDLLARELPNDYFHRLVIIIDKNCPNSVHPNISQSCLLQTSLGQRKQLFN